MRTLPLLLLSLAACGGSSKSTLGNVAGAGGPPGPAPTITWSGQAPTDGGSFATTGMPAVSDDGSQVLIDWVQGDGGRGYPNLRLLVVDRADKTLDTKVVLDADQVEDMSGPVDVAPFNGFLTDGNATMRWRPLTSAAVEGEPEGDEMYATRQTSKLGDVAVRFDDRAHLMIEQGGKVVVDTVKKEWLQVDRPMYEGAEADEVCSNPIYLSSVHVDGARRLAVIGFEYHGNDSCWEPSGQYHVVTW